jgi:diacylglycerol O-acyltransferase / wax synthase
MRPFAGLDATFLYSDTPGAPMHTLKVGILELDGDPVHHVHTALSRRVHLLPGFRDRVVFVPGGLGHPVWAPDPSFTLERHLRSTAVESPHDRPALHREIGRIASLALARDRPLWEVWVVEGLSDGRVAVVAKLHHALADGMAAVQMLDALLHPEPSKPQAWLPAPLPRRRRLLRSAISGKVGSALALAPLIRRTVRSGLHIAKQKKHGDVSFTSPFSTPRTLFNGHLEGRREYTTSSVDLATVKAVSKHLGVTVTDVVLTMVSGAASSYLSEVSEAPNMPLIAAVPVGSAKRAGHGNNHVSNLIVNLHSDQPDPVARTHAIHRETRNAKQAHDILGADTMREWAEYAPPVPFAAVTRLYEYARMANRHRPPVNVIVSCVRGPSEVLAGDAVRLHELFSVGPLLQGIGLNVTVWSYADRLGFSWLSGAGLPRGLDDLADRAMVQLQSLAELIPKEETALNSL